jgi:hypothetical protein
MSYSAGTKRHDSAKIITTPSNYGSHKVMVVDSKDFDVELREDQVICKDDFHYYVTLKSRLDDGLADPNRYGSPKNNLKKVEVETEEGG